MKCFAQAWIPVDCMLQCELVLSVWDILELVHELKRLLPFLKGVILQKTASEVLRKWVYGIIPT